MSETVRSGEAFYDYHDGLGALRDQAFIEATEDAEKIVLNSPNKRKHSVDEQTTRLDDLYRKLCGHPTKNQQVFVRYKKMYPITTTTAKSAEQNSNHISDHCYAILGPSKGEKFADEEFILDGIAMPLIHDKYTAAFRLRRINQPENSPHSHFYMTFNDVFRLDFMEQFNVDVQSLPTVLEQMNNEAALYFQAADSVSDSAEEQKKTAERLSRSMTRRLQPLFDTRTELLLSTPVYYKEAGHQSKIPEITDSTRIDKAGEAECDIIAGRALRIIVKRDYCEEPYSFKPFLVLHDDKDNVSFAVPADKEISVFSL